MLAEQSSFHPNHSNGTYAALCNSGMLLFHQTKEACVWKLCGWGKVKIICIIWKYMCNLIKSSSKDGYNKSLLSPLCYRLQMLWVKTHFLFGKITFFLVLSVIADLLLNSALLSCIISILLNLFIAVCQSRPPQDHHTLLQVNQAQGEQSSAQGLTRDVGGDFSERCLAKPLGGSRPDWHQVCGSRMQAREHVVCLVPQLGHCTARTWHVYAWVWRLDTLIADLETGKRRQWIKTGDNDALCWMLLTAC